MIDLGFFRSHLDDIELMARNRGVALDLGRFREIDSERRALITSVERLKAERNTASGEIARLKTSGGDAASLLSRMKDVSEEIKRADLRVSELDEGLREFMLTVPNIPHASVPVGHGAEGNVEVRRWGKPPEFAFAPRPHWEIGEACGILDFEAAVKMSGARFALYRGLGARLERALANFFLDVHTREHGYTEILPPFLINSASLVADGKLPKFAGDMFHIEGHDLWLLLLRRRSLLTFIGMRLLMRICSTKNFVLGLLVFGRRLGPLGKILGGLSGSISFRRWRCLSLRGRNLVMTSWSC